MVPNHHRNCASEPQEKAEWTAPSSQQWWIKYPRYGWIIGKIWARPTFISHQLWLFIINVHINSTFFLLVLYYNSIKFLNIEKKIGKRNWQRYIQHHTNECSLRSVNLGTVDMQYVHYAFFHFIMSPIRQLSTNIKP